MSSKRLYQHALATIFCFGGVYMATYLQWPITLDLNPPHPRMSNGTHDWMPTVLLISIDGLKPQYLEGGNMPVLKGLSEGNDSVAPDKKRGILTSESMIPVSPSLTFPNHWTLQTGLLPSSHGIVANDFQIQSANSGTDDSFYYTDPARSWNASWWHGTPIWENLESLEIKTANLMWPGPPVTSRGIQSTYFQRYEKSWSLNQRFDKIMSWLDMEDRDRPSFICAYAPDVDTVTHSLGPDKANKKVSDALRKVDSFILDLLNGVMSRNTSSIIDVVIVSDHGMTSTSNDRLVYLEELLGQDLYSRMDRWEGWPNVGLHFNSITDFEDAKVQLKEKEKSGASKFVIATRNELVKLWGWEDTAVAKERMAGLWILPEIGWSITTKEEMASFGQKYRPKGNHGYLALNDDMHAFFLALGPSFSSSIGHRMKSFANFEIHNLVMDLLHVPEIDRVANNGTRGFWQPYLRSKR